mmetsp:Transcript_9828/g.12769  ORF Transcript_9828/g.12769 Transcript_9828/m.12769 type:complete len:254 (-) Transcript_9828:183-944(-)
MEHLNHTIQHHNAPSAQTQQPLNLYGGSGNTTTMTDPSALQAWQLHHQAFPAAAAATLTRHLNHSNPLNHLIYTAATATGHGGSLPNNQWDSRTNGPATATTGVASGHVGGFPGNQGTIQHHSAGGMNGMSHGGAMNSKDQETVKAAPSGDGSADNPIYVNAKQYRRILKRREHRAVLEEYFRKKKLAAAAKGGNGSGEEDGRKRTYTHESRHRHAMKRPRGPGGRFLTKDELQAYYEKRPEEAALAGYQLNN